MSNTEIWRDIKGYEGLYQVSNFGRVKSVEKTCIIGKGNYYRPEHIKKLFIMTSKKNKIPYYQVSLSKNSVVKKHLVHRLVAIAFVENPENKPYVNHLDGCGLNNVATNLEWTTNRGNQLYAHYILKTAHLTKPIFAYDKNTGKLAKSFESMTKAAEWLLSTGKTKDKTCLTGVIKSCKGKIPSYMGYIWRYENDASDDKHSNSTERI